MSALQRNGRNGELRSSTALGRIAAAVAVTLGITFVVLTLGGVARGWHPMPTSAMWDGYLGFWFRLVDGDTAAWWAQQGGSRLVLPRVLFWTDLKFFAGSGWFLIACNLVLVAGIALALVVALRARLIEVRGSIDPRDGFVLTGAVIVTMVVAWMQSRNLLWGFQTKVFLSVLVPLVAFIVLGRSEGVRLDRPRRSTALFWIAWGLTVLSVGTSASGLLIPVLATAMSLLQRTSWKRPLILAITSVACIVVYGIGYVVPTNQAGSWDALVQSPVRAGQFLLAYLSGPVYYGTESRWFGLVSGAAFMVLVVAFFVHEVRSRPRSGTGLAMVNFAVYGTVLAVVTTPGGLRYGPDEAYASRYQTPMLVAWASLLVLAAPRIQGAIGRGASWVPVALVAIPIVLIPQQLKASTDQAANHRARDVAALAIALGVPDGKVIAALSDDPELAVALGRRAMESGLTVLGTKPYVDLISDLGTTAPIRPPVACTGFVDTATAISGSELARVTGWVAPAAPLAPANAILDVLDPHGTIVGYVVSGLPRPDVAALVSGTPENPGFIGYVAPGLDVRTLSLSGPDGTCSTPLR